MSMTGSLQEVSVPDVIDLARQMGEEVGVFIETPHGIWALYVRQGRVVHAEGPDVSGEEAVHRVLSLRTGTFRIETGRQPPATTIQKPWNTLLLEALRHLDETSEYAVQAIPSTEEKEEWIMARPRKTREIIAEILDELLETSTDIVGAAVVGIEGLIYSARFPLKDMDENLIAAVAAAIYGLSRRNIQQLRQGEFVQALIEGTEGYTLVRSINPKVIFVALLPKEVNLGMAFAEARTVSARLAEVLQGLQ